MLHDITTYRLVNVRSLLDSNNIYLPSLSVLVGKNGSGKSSFMRFFQILSQSFGINKRSPILFFGDEVDFGSFEEAISSESTDNYIGFGFSVKFRASSNIVSALIGVKNEGEVFCKIMKNKERTFLSEVEICINDDKITIIFLEHKIQSIVINGIDFSQYIAKFSVKNGFIIPELLWNSESGEFRSPWYFESLRCGMSDFSELLLKHMHQNTQKFSIKEKLKKMTYCNDNCFLPRIAELSNSKKWKSYIDVISYDREEFLKVKSFFTFTYLSGIILCFNDALKDISRSIYYIGPFRAAAQRYYRIQDLDISRIDSTGNNVPAYINSLGVAELENFKQWVEKFFGFVPAKKVSAGHISVSIKQDGEIASNLADVGFGYSQILPIVIQLWQFRQLSARQARSRPRNFRNCCIFLIEQPELHLHPAFQRKILNAIVDVLKECNRNGINLKIILETHSEKIIDELGLMIEKTLFDANDASVYLFEKEKGICTITHSSFDKSGVLMNWPFGFFDGE